MSEPKKIKFSDAISQETTGETAGTTHGKPTPTHATDAEQSREAQEAKEAEEHQGSTLDHIMDIGRGNQQAGRQGQ